MTGSGRAERNVDVLIVGAGPAGLAAGAELAAAGAGRVEILEREPQAGGIPRHCHHGGFGGHFTRGGTSGPAYARQCVAAAVRAGAALRTGVAVTGWAGPLAVETTGPTGLERITARAVVLATGARERPRSARLIPGTRPPGVYTTGELQQAVHRYGQRIGTRAVVVGDEPVAYAAVATLRAAGIRIVAMVTDRPAAPLRVRQRVPLLTGATVTGIEGRTRLTGVTLRRTDGRTTTLHCDTVVLTGDFVPENELARRAGIVLDPGTRGPAHDAAYRTSQPGVFAAGNLLHAVERAGVAAQEGRAVAVSVLHRLSGSDEPAVVGRPVVVDAPLRWIAPNVTGPDAITRPAGDRFVLRTARRLSLPLLVVTQGRRELHRQRLLLPAVPGRPLHLAAGWTDRVDPEGPAVRVFAS
ncbi:FAD-dependent oxidoreductase [Streptomyces sp. NBC_01102]|uniref:NAD(P)/FAD-dependent oxidoreductase n=1 Tax=Streptomyces sp. NBC_01102 TaxID=2903749 RepID=UPI0038645F2F|nr:FAD-dependent oxidoreductase [Streptomyces sp. NBC_01102]